MIKVTAIGGVPGSGKSTLVKDIISQSSSVNTADVFGLTVSILSDVKKIVMGWYNANETFGGTDRYPLNVQPKANNFFAEMKNFPDWDGWEVIFEGDRLFNEKTINYLIEELELPTRIIIVTISDEVFEQRQASRGNKQNAQWLKGRKTKIENLKKIFQVTEIFNDNSEQFANNVAIIKNAPFRTKKADGGLRLDEGYYGSPRWSYEILDCSMPMTFDTYSNCAHQCVYCFSFFQRAVGASADDYLHHKVRAVNVDRVKRMFLEPDKYAGQFASYIKKRIVLQWGGLSDGFDWYERKFRKSLELLRFFREIDYPISISTKGVWFVDDPEYRAVLKDAKNTHWKYSIITTNEEHVKKLEAGVPTSKARFEAMRKLNDLGVGATTLRFRPFVLGTSDKCIPEMMQLAKEVGCYSVTTEFLGWESRASNSSRQRLNIMSEVLGYDVWKFYVEKSAHNTGLLRLNYDLKRPYIKEMKEEAEKNGLHFFVSDAHHKEDSEHAGCCGLPSTGPLSNTNRGQYAHAIKLAKENGFVKWSDIAEEARELLGGIDVTAAEGFPMDTAERMKRKYQSMYDYMHDVWNKPTSWQSPARYFGGALVPAQPDENGDIVYLYNKPFIEDDKHVASVNELAIFLRMVGKPNAERYDEATSDGSAHGHVAFPVVVFSRKRAHNATTMDLLEKSRINYKLVVESGEIDAYQERYPNADILVIKDNAGIRYAREQIYQEFKKEGYAYVWMLDDDVKTVLDDKGKETTLRAMFSSMERFAEEYTNIAWLSFDTESLYSSHFRYNLMKRGLSLVNLNTPNSFDGKCELGEDIEFVLRNCLDGFTAVVHNDYVVQFSDIPGGGASSLYLSRGNDSKILTQQFPDYVEPDDGDFVVKWNKIRTAINSKEVELLLRGE